MLRGPDDPYRTLGWFAFAAFLAIGFYFGLAKDDWGSGAVFAALAAVFISSAAPARGCANSGRGGVA